MGDELEGGSDAELRPAASSSPLAGLRQRREDAVKVLHVDLPVPRYEGIDLYVRYRPVPEHRVTAITKVTEKSKDREKNIIAQATILAEVCIGVFAVVKHDGEDVEVSVDDDDPHGEWPKFDERLGKILGLEHTTRAAEVVRRLYLTDGDVLATASRLAEWSGYTLENVEEREGN